MFGRATIVLGIGPHSSLVYHFVSYETDNFHVVLCPLVPDPGDAAGDRKSRWRVGREGVDNVTVDGGRRPTAAWTGMCL